MSDMTDVTKDKLIADVKLVIADTEELLRATAGAAGEKAGELRERIAIRLRDAKERLADLEASPLSLALCVDALHFLLISFPVLRTERPESNRSRLEHQCECVEHSPDRKSKHLREPSHRSKSQ